MKSKVLVSCLLLFGLLSVQPLTAQNKEYKRSITVAADGSGDYRTITESIEAIRAFMDYTVTVHIAPGTYKEKIVIPSWLENVTFIGKGAPEETVITFDDHANINKMGTFRTYTVKVAGNGLTFRNLTIENNAPQLGQAVALHTEGDRLKFINCRFLGNQDTIFTGTAGSRLLFEDCYIEGTTDFIFGPATALFKDCTIHSKRDSYITAASTPEAIEVGYVFWQCRLTAAEGVTKVYLGRPWRPYAHTAFIRCTMGKHILPEGWHNWRNPENEKTARYQEFGNEGAGADRTHRVRWSNVLTEAEAKQLTDVTHIYNKCSSWNPAE